MYFDDEAAAFRKKWYVSRPDPTEELLWPFFERQDDHVIKLSMILALADGRMVMCKRDVEEAVALTMMVYSRLPQLLEYAHRTPDTEMMAWLSEILRNKEGWISHSLLLKKASNRGANKTKFTEFISTLMERGDVIMASKKATGGKFYCWHTFKKAEIP